MTIWTDPTHDPTYRLVRDAVIEDEDGNAVEIEVEE